MNTRIAIAALLCACAFIPAPSDRCSSSWRPRNELTASGVDPEGMVAAAQPGGITTREAWTTLRDELLMKIREVVGPNLVAGAALDVT
jgi:hypothetical protein